MSIEITAMFKKRILKVIIIVLFVQFFIFGIAHAEVMDKEPNLTQNIVLGFLSVGLCFIAARFKPWTLVLVAPLPLLYFVGLIIEINDPNMGPSILDEAGYFYIFSGYFLTCSVLASIIAGLMLRK
jgi:hypothetical protein